jgi:hypothetical protein
MILTILFKVKHEKITLFDTFLVLLGPIISQLFACSNEEKNKQKQQRVLALVPSLWSLRIFLPPDVGQHERGLDEDDGEERHQPGPNVIKPFMSVNYGFSY